MKNHQMKAVYSNTVFISYMHWKYLGHEFRIHFEHSFSIDKFLTSIQNNINCCTYMCSKVMFSFFLAFKKPNLKTSFAGMENLEMSWNRKRSFLCVPTSAKVNWSICTWKSLFSIVYSNLSSIIHRRRYSLEGWTA